LEFWGRDWDDEEVYVGSYEICLLCMLMDGELVPGFGVLGLLVASWIEEVVDRVFKLLHFGARGTAAAYSRRYVEGFCFEVDASTFVVVHSLLIS
jgi:hypothetical protein